MKKSFKFIQPYARRPEQRFYMAAVGLHESMEPGLVNRPNGTWDWLFMFFHTPVVIEVEGSQELYPANTLMIWDETQSHFYGNADDRWAHSWIHCQGSIVPEVLKEAGLTTGIYPNMMLNPLLEKYLPLIHEERLRSDMDAMILEEFFICLLREIGRIHSPSSNSIPQRIHLLKQFLETHYHSPLRLEDLCEHAAMSKPHLISEFRKHVGMPPIEYLIRVRLGHARFLLLNRNLSVGEIAARVGYSDIYHFSKLFKKHLGKSPSAFRGAPPQRDF